MAQASISIDQPPAGGNVSPTFTASGGVMPAGGAVTVTLDGTSASSVSVMGSTWSAGFQNIPPGKWTLQACVPGIPPQPPQVCTSEPVNVQ